MTDISKLGMFVTAATVPPAGTRLEIAFDTPQGRLSAPARVVRVQEEVAGSSGPKGVGLELEDVTGDLRVAIDAYVDSIAAQDLGDSNDIAQAPFAQLRHFMGCLDRNALYEALRMKSTATATEISSRIALLLRLFEAAKQEATIPQRTRFDRALAQLNRIETLMKNAESRLEYDFRYGHVHADERLAASAAGTGPTVRVLRETWHRLFPAREGASRQCFAQALQFRRTNDLPRALRSLREAIDLEPFNPELRQTWTAWTDPKPQKAAAR
jgi:hypothetical protein